MPEQTREITLRFLAQPTDVNFGGNVHGGSVMKWIDQAGYVSATAWSGTYCVTVFVGDLNFYRPIQIGNIVEARAKIIHTGRTSMHIAVDLRACDPRKCLLEKVVRCIVVFVAVDENGDAIEVPPWRPANEEDKILEKYAKKIVELRKANQKELEALSVET